MKKKAFTIIELLLATAIFSMIFMLGISQTVLVSEVLYDGQTEMTNRSDLNEVIFYMTREIQSAENIRITNNGKQLEIQESGRDSYNLVYSFCEGYPTDYLAFKDKKMIDVEYDECSFTQDKESIIAKVAVVKNSVTANQEPMLMTVRMTPRKSSTEEESE